MSALSQKISYGSLLSFSVPTILSYIFLNIYFIIDGIFVSRAVGTSGLAAVNVAIPVLAVTMALATMIGTGGGALVASMLGEKRLMEARQNFSLLTFFCVAGSAVLSGVGITFMTPLLRLLGADDNLLPLCADYVLPLFLSQPFVMCGLVLDNFLVVEGKPKLAMLSAFVGGFINVALDYLFLFVMGMGIEGAAIATGIGYSASTVIGAYYFGARRKGTLRLTKPVLRLRVIKKSLTNGMSEMITMLAMSFVIIIMNRTMMNLAGDDGVAAISIAQYMEDLLMAAYLGYAEGIAPLMSFNFGEKNRQKMRLIYNRSLKIIALFGTTTFLLALLIAEPVTNVFAASNPHVLKMTVHGFTIFAVGFLFVGFNIYASSMFTALNDGKTSALLSFFHTMIFMLGMMLMLPHFFGIDGVWFAKPAAEALGVVMAVYFFNTKRREYF